MIVPMNSLGARIVALTIGSCTSAIFPSGYSEGFVTTSFLPSSSVTLYTTLGAVEINVKPASRSNLSLTISR
jgi:hypothetical protein